MKIFYNRINLDKEIASLKSKNRTIGFVPTMGSLHQGHLSLVRLAGEQCDIVVCSVFVNPTQFNDPKDYNLYPKHIETDIELLKNENCDLLYLPKVNDVYPNGVEKESYPLNEIGNVLEGECRPGHFDGVIQVVKRLFDIVSPHKAYFGMKDFQQLSVIRWMVSHFNIPIEIVGGPIIRDESGLALSSRNERLTADQKISALKLSQALFSIRDSYTSIEFSRLRSELVSELEQDASIKVEYLELANTKNLQPVSSFKDASSVGVFLAARIGDIRLIDNVVLF